LRFFLFVAVATGGHARAATVCVNPGGTGGCFATIQAAVDATDAGDEISIEAGTYSESVEVTGPKRVIRGAGAASTRIEATGQQAIKSTAKELEIHDLTLTGGSNEGLRLSFGKILINSCVIEDNFGDGIFGGGSVQMKVVDTTVRNNSFDQIRIVGGAAELVRLEVVRSTISSDDGTSGGIAAVAGGRLFVDDSTVSGAQTGILANVSRFRIRRSTITGNGTGIRVGRRSSIQSSIIAGNGPGFDLTTLGGIERSVRSLGYNVLGMVDVPVDLTGRTPLDALGVDDPLLGPLEDNGGPTLTHEPLAGSPALGRVVPTPLCKMPDQRGVSRIPAPCDSGAVEAP
jgi:hypothetical protein